MTTREATKEARKRWGPTGRAYLYAPRESWETLYVGYMVERPFRRRGKVVRVMVRMGECPGRGGDQRIALDWAPAFANADKRAKVST